MARAGLGPDWTCIFANDVDPKKASTYVEIWGETEFRSLLQKSDGSRDPPNRRSEALEMTEIWPSEGAIAHFLAVSMCRVTLDTAIDTFATGLYVERVLLRAISGSVPEAPSAAAISLPPVCGEVPCRSLAEFRHGRRVGPFQQAGPWPV